MSFNLDTLALVETSELHLTHPATGEHLYADEDKKQPVKIIIHGLGSKVYRNAITAMQNRAIKRKGKSATAEQLREEGIDMLVKCSEKAVNLNYRGKPLDNSEAFRSLYLDDSFAWLKSQVDEFLGENANFMQA